MNNGTEKSYVSTMDQLVITAQVGAATGYIGSWLGSLAPKTRRAYGQAIGRFARHIGNSAEEAWAWVLCADGWRVNQSVMDWVAVSREKLTSATICQTLSALSSAMRVARAAGFSRNELAVRRPKVTPYRDTRGPPIKSIAAMLEIASKQRSPFSERDLVIVLLASSMALRRGEIESLRICDVDGDSLLVAGKGSGGDRTPYTIPRQVVTAISAWLAVRPPSDSDSLLVSLDHRTKGSPLSARSIERTVQALGIAAGLTSCAPHSLRHSAITAALDETNGDVRSVKHFSRHSSVETVLVYDDKRNDQGGRLAQFLADKIELARAF